ncbi:slit protein-like protein 1, partial [Sarcoptes scabiei]
LLNKNRIKCLRRGIFADLKHLNLLHLGRNPFICDCNLRWLSLYLKERPSLETSDARCEEPKRNNRKRLTQLNSDRFKCKGTEELRTKYASQCMIDTKCPKNCVCEGTIVDCSRLNLHHLPENVPKFATELDLRNNSLMDIQDGALNGAENLQDLLLSNNRLKHISPKMFASLKNLTTL